MVLNARIDDLTGATIMASPAAIQAIAKARGWDEWVAQQLENGSIMGVDVATGLSTTEGQVVMIHNPRGPEEDDHE